MLRWIVGKLLASALVILGSLSLVFVIVHIVPGDPASIMLMGTPASPETAALLQHEFGWDRPLALQYASYIRDTLSGHFGQSLITREAVLPKLLEQFAQTFVLTLAGMAVSILIGIGLGVLAALYVNRWPDYAIRFVGLLGLSMPAFWTGILLLLLFAVHLHWFPVTGIGGLRFLVLPAAALGIMGSGILTRMIRNTMLETMREPFVTTLRSKGLAEWTIVFKHVLRNAFVPAITLIGMLIGEMLAGSAVIEIVFGRQGIGRLIVDAIMTKDLPMVQGAVALTATIYVIVNLLVDVSYAWIDPRMRQFHGKASV